MGKRELLRFEVFVTSMLVKYEICNYIQDSSNYFYFNIFYMHKCLIFALYQGLETWAESSEVHIVYLIPADYFLDWNLLF